MAYTQDLLKAQEALKRHVQGADQRIAETQGQARDILGASDIARKSGTADILGEIGSKYGISGAQRAPRTRADRLGRHRTGRLACGDWLPLERWSRRLPPPGSAFQSKR